MSKNLALLALFLIAANTNAATIANGSLTGASDVFSLIPEGWETLFPDPDPRWNPDTYGENSPTTISSLSPDGGTFVAAAHATTQPPTGKEGLQQLVTDLVIGVTYRLDFYQSNLGVGETNVNSFGGGVYSWNTDAVWELYLDGNPTGVLSDVLSPETGPLPNNSWFASSLVFTATATAQAVGFAPLVVAGENAFLGIDGIRITVVPVPSALWLMLSALGFLGYTRHRPGRR